MDFCSKYLILQLGLFLTNRHYKQNSSDLLILRQLMSLEAYQIVPLFMVAL